MDTVSNCLLSFYLPSAALGPPLWVSESAGTQNWSEWSKVRGSARTGHLHHSPPQGSCPRGAGKSKSQRWGGGQSETGETHSSGQEDHYTQELPFACPRSSLSASSMGWETVQKLPSLTEQMWKRAPRRGKVGFPRPGLQSDPSCWPYNQSILTTDWVNGLADWE